MDAYNLIYESKTLYLRAVSETLSVKKVPKELSNTILQWVDDAFNLGVEAAVNPACLFVKEEKRCREKGLRIALEELDIDVKDNLEEK